MNCHCHQYGYEEGHYILPPLPYDFNALDDFLDAETLKIHHDRHHAAYVSAANEAMTKLAKLSRGDVCSSQARGLTQDLAFNLGGHILHCLYWKSMCPDSAPPTGALAMAIERDFGSLEGLQRLFRGLAITLQGSGWVVLGLDKMSCRLMIHAIKNHQDAFTLGFKALVVCDVWEHAYYLKYQNKRAEYVDAFWNHIDWTHAENYLNHCFHHE